MRRLAVPLFVLNAFLSSALHAQSQGVQGNALLGVCRGVLAQGAGGVSGDHDKLCACLVRETSTKLTAAEMMAYAESGLNNAPPPPAVMDKIVAIATGCLHEAQ